MYIYIYMYMYIFMYIYIYILCLAVGGPSLQPSNYLRLRRPAWLRPVWHMIALTSLSHAPPSPRWVRCVAPFPFSCGYATRASAPRPPLGGPFRVLHLSRFGGYRCKTENAHGGWGGDLPEPPRVPSEDHFAWGARDDPLGDLFWISHIYTHIHILYIYMCICVYIYYISICVYVYTYNIHIYIYIYIYIFMCICKYMYYISICVYI